MQDWSGPPPPPAEQSTPVRGSSSVGCNAGYSPEIRYKQDRGIPMGINPAVYMANYYLFHYEYSFVLRLVRLMEQTPPTGVLASVFDTLMSGTQAELDGGELRPYVGDAALSVLNCFRFTNRYTDDLTSGPNR